jgi:hypothetical protein
MATYLNDTDTMTEKESLRYTNAYIATSNAIGDAIIILKRLEVVTFDPTEQQRIVLERRRLEDEYAANERGFLAFHAEGLAMHPPRQDQVDEILSIASDLALLTRQKATFQAVLSLANKAVSNFAAIRGEDPA